MKKIVILILSLLFNNYLFSQVSIGLTFGTNICKIKHKADYSNNPFILPPTQEELKTIIGLIVGIPLEIQLSERFGLFTALTYHQKGYKLKTEYNILNTYANIDGWSRINFLELPIQAKYYITKNKLSTYIAVGSSIGYALSGRAKAEIEINDENGYQSESFDEKIKFKDFKEAGMNQLDVSLVLGGGISYKAWRGDIFLNINYNHGFINMVKDDENSTYEGAIEKNRGVNITCGYMIPLSKKEE